MSRRLTKTYRMVLLYFASDKTLAIVEAKKLRESSYAEGSLVTVPSASAIEKDAEVIALSGKFSFIYLLSALL